MSFSFQALLMAFCLLPLVGAFVGEVDFGDLEAILFFYSALSSIGSILLTQRHQFFVLSSFGEVDFVDLEVPI